MGESSLFFLIPVFGEVSQHEPAMHEEGGKMAIVANHDAVALTERLTVMARGGSLLGVAGHGEVGIRQGKA